jgi:hypothetical protein
MRRAIVAVALAGNGNAVKGNAVEGNAVEGNAVEGNAVEGNAVNGIRALFGCSASHRANRLRPYGNRCRR